MLIIIAVITATAIAGIAVAAYMAPADHNVVPTTGGKSLTLELNENLGLKEH